MSVFSLIFWSPQMSSEEQEPCLLAGRTAALLKGLVGLLKLELHPCTHRTHTELEEEGCKRSCTSCLMPKIQHTWSCSALRPWRFPLRGPSAEMEAQQKPAARSPGGVPRTGTHAQLHTATCSAPPPGTSTPRAHEAGTIHRIACKQASRHTAELMPSATGLLRDCPGTEFPRETQLLEQHHHRDSNPSSEPWDQQLCLLQTYGAWNHGAGSEPPAWPQSAETPQEGS